MSDRFKPNPEMQHKTETIMHMMHATPIGGVLTYQAMRERLNEPVTSQHPALRTALDDAKDDGMVFVNVIGEGYKRLSDKETASTGVAIHRKKLFRGAKRGIRTAATIKDLSKFTSEERNHLWANRTLFETIKTNTHGNSINAKTKTAKDQEPSSLEREMQKLSAAKEVQPA